MPQIASQNSFDFEKGCYVGQEVVLRMHRGGARKRVVRVRLTGRCPLAGRLSSMGSCRSGRSGRQPARARSRCWDRAEEARAAGRRSARGAWGPSWKRREVTAAFGSGNTEKSGRFYEAKDDRPLS